MQKIVTLQCADCGEKLTFKVGADRDMATVNDAVALLPESKERDKILEWMVKLANSEYEEKLVSLYGNLAEPMCSINYEALGAKIKLMDKAADNDAAVRRYKTSEAFEKLNMSKIKWLELMKRDGVVAFHAIFYCKKCKTLHNRIYLRVHSGGMVKEYVNVYPNRCDVCKNDLELVDDDNMGFIYAGLPTTVACSKCGKPYTVESVNFAVKPPEKNGGQA